MALSPVMRMQLINGVERVLHAPGNPEGDLKEMTLVLDYHMEKERAAELAADTASALKAHSRIFSNVRCNLVHWKADEDIQNEVMPLSLIWLGRFRESYEQTAADKRAEVLCDYLKRFHARSRLLIVFTDFAFLVEEREKLRAALTPFLQYKILFTDGERVERSGGI